jgi:hypothetical protein
MTLSAWKPGQRENSVSRCFQTFANLWKGTNLGVSQAPITGEWGGIWAGPVGQAREIVS